MFVTTQKTMLVIDAMATCIGFEKTVLKTGLIELNNFNSTWYSFFGFDK